jgi:hypothetical protein
MVREQSFSGFDDENPYDHLREFEQLCSCLSITGMAQETLRWKLFPFSLAERAKQWYAHNVGKVDGEWEELRDRFYLAFFPISLITSQLMLAQTCLSPTTCCFNTSGKGLARNLPNSLISLPVGRSCAKPLPKERPF